MLNGFEWKATEYKQPCVFLLGGFDGLHIGHKKLLEFAKTFNLPIGIMTMSGVKGQSLFTDEERAQIFRREGAAFAYALSFTEELKHTPKEQFLDELLKKFNVAAFVCGKDFCFGKEAQGNPAFIREYTEIPTYDLDILNVDGHKVSTSAIKALIRNGEIEQANQLLATPFFLSQTVQEGRKVGRKLGFPTANMPYPKDKFMLKEGVYGVHTTYGGKTYVGICNVGDCPTFDVREKKAESYFDGLTQMIYGERIEVYFDRYLRDIEKFESQEALKAQLELDIRRIKNDFLH